MPRKTVTNWGNYPRLDANFTEGSDLRNLEHLVKTSHSLIARGNGRCYGDSSLGDNIFSTLRLNKFLAFDKNAGTIECESGVLLSEILDVIVPHGFFLPVTPGTKFITVGGAIAADVHGKNHHCEGSFANHVLHLDLLTANGNVVRCSPGDNADLFWPTCGGMGMTGIILSAKFGLKPIETSYITQTSKKAEDIEETMRLFESAEERTYSVAWIDCFAGSRNLGRSVLKLGEHSRITDLPAKFKPKPLCPAPKNAIDLPVFLPAITLNYVSTKAFNSYYYSRQTSRDAMEIVHFDPYFYPLDRIHNWNRIYGRRGFVQYQFVLPVKTSYDGMVKILEKIRGSGQGSPLAVLKLFGKVNPKAVMSFPMEGYTLALDFKVNAAVFRLLDELDDIVLKHGGRIYLAKDARMSSDTFRKSYIEIVPSGRFSSAQSKRLEF